MACTSCSARLLALLASAALVVVAAGCSTKRVEETHTPNYREEVAPLLTTRCASCHQGPSAAGGFRVTSYLETIGCVADGAPATRKDDAPILRVLDRPDHASIGLTGDERAILTAWVAAGAPAFRNDVHPPGFTDPRSPDFHASFLRARKWQPMLDPKSPDLCGTCHEGAPVRTDPPRRPAPGATACTTCHTEPEGPLACNTCHGGAGHAYPPRDACFFPGQRADVTHAAHVEPSNAKSSGLPCSTCHPVPKTGEIFDGTNHANGHIDVWLPEGPDNFDPVTEQCSTRCHSGPSGARPRPAWSESTKMACSDCHGAPPKPHFATECWRCHREANATGTALFATNLHLDGKVEFGDGSGKCGACHGTGDDPWPTTGAHPAHKAPKNGVPVDCTTCHEFPPALPHPEGIAPKVRLGGLALKGGLAPTFDPATKTCSGVYCHSQPGATLPSPSWTSGTAASTCGGCHSVPPPPPHTSATTCGTGFCHANAISGGVLTPSGKAHHVNGTIDLSVP